MRDPLETRECPVLERQIAIVGQIAAQRSSSARRSIAGFARSSGATAGAGAEGGSPLGGDAGELVIDASSFSPRTRRNQRRTIVILPTSDQFRAVFLPQAMCGHVPLLRLHYIIRCERTICLKHFVQIDKVRANRHQHGKKKWEGSYDNCLPTSHLRAQHSVLSTSLGRDGFDRAGDGPGASRGWVGGEANGLRDLRANRSRHR